MSLWQMRPSLSEESYWDLTLCKQMERSGSKRLVVSAPSESQPVKAGCIGGCFVHLRKWELWKQPVCSAASWDGKMVDLCQYLQCQQSHSLVPGYQSSWNQQCHQRPVLSGKDLVAASVRKSNHWLKHVTSRERWRTKSETKLHLCTFLYMVYMIITQTRCTMALLLAVISEERRCHRCPSLYGPRPWEKNLETVQNTKSESNLIERIHARVMRLSIEWSRCFKPTMRNPSRSDFGQTKVYFHQNNR